MPKRFVPKGGIQPKKPFLIYHCHDFPNPKKFGDDILIASFDPGCTSIGFCHASYNIKTNKILPLIIKKLSFKEKGKDNTNPQFAECIRVLDLYEDIFLNCHYILVETQIGFALNNVKIAQHMISYFMTKFRNRGNYPHIVEINSSDKTRMLGCDLKEKKDYKKWSVEKAWDLLNNDFEKNQDVLDSFEFGKRSKKDDISDAICHTKVWCMYISNALSPSPLHTISLPI